MSALTSSIVTSWSGVSTWAKASSSSRCHGCRGRTRAPWSPCAPSKPDELGGDLLDVAARPTLGLLPVGATHLVERGLLAADVAGDLVELVGRDVEAVGRLAALGRRVLEDEVLARGALHGALHHLDEAADAVLLVHDEVTGAQLEGVDLVAPLRRHPAHVLGGGARAGGGAGEVGLRDDGEPLGGDEEPGADAARRHRHQPRSSSASGEVRARTSCSPSTSVTRLARPAPSVTTRTDQPSAVRRLSSATASSVLPRNVGETARPSSTVSSSSSPAERGEVQPPHAELAGLLAQLGEAAEGRRAEHGLEIDGDGAAAGRGGPAGLEELLARRDEVVGPVADALWVARGDDGVGGQHLEEGLHPSTSAGASDSIPSTAMPLASLSRRSATPGSWSANAAARSRTDG